MWGTGEVLAPIGNIEMPADRSKSQQGFTLVEMIVVVAVLGILVAIVIPALLTAVDRSRQRRSMADMTNIAKANGMYQVDAGRFVAALADLQPNYMQIVPANDAWGNAFQYTPAGNQRSYELRSLGKDGAVGPAAPPLWFNEPFEPDLVMDTGQFTQMPAAQ
jgi:general secretion pathway protein G